MERQQHQHGSKQPRPPIPERSSQQLRKPKAAFSLGKPVWNRSLVVLGSAWVVVVIIAFTAVSGLLSPNLSSNNQTPGAAPVRVTATTAQATSQSRLPLWLFGAIALSCATGSILVSKQVNRPPRPRKNTKPKRLAPYIAPAATESFFLTTQSQPPVATVPSVALVPGSVPHAPSAAPFMAPATLMQLAHQESQAVRKTPNVQAPSATANNKPLDWGEASLADKLDIRKPRSISSLL